jgi:hypothetical protein
MKKITKSIVIFTFLFIVLFSTVSFAGPGEDTDSTNITTNSIVFTLKVFDINK